MKFDIFKRLYSEAREYDDLSMYLSERGWQEWMDEYTDVNDITAVLTDIYTLSNGGVDDFCNVSRMQMTALANMVCVKYRTIQRWKKDSEIPERDKLLIAFAIINNK